MFMVSRLCLTKLDFLRMHLGPTFAECGDWILRTQNGLEFFFAPHRDQTTSSAHWDFCLKILSNWLSNSCHTSKKLEFWLKIVNIIYFSTPKLIKGTLGFILEIMKKIARWRHKSEISKRNVKIMISPLLFRL